MKCPACQHDNRDVAKFCEQCATPLARACGSCGCDIRPTAKFCDECGTPVPVRGNPPTATAPARAISEYTPAHLAERIRTEQAALEARGAEDGERKTITALFADLKGSTALIEGLDPEEVREIIDPALQLMMDAVHEYEGYVAQALGDGIFALFGAPLAHEDHPQRAVYAGLRMQEGMGRYADTLRSKGYPPLQMRVGLNTGEVVVRSIRKDDLHTDYVPVGHSTNLAARMEQLASPGTIVVSAHTHRLTDGYFAFKDLGLTQIKGVEEPLNIYEVLGVGPLRTRLQISARRGLTQFVGRQSEMLQFNKALNSANAGQGQIVGVMGEPGLGKSRLFYEFKLLLVSGCLVLEANAVSHGKGTAFLPAIELLKNYFRIEAADDEPTRREKVTGKVLNLDHELEDILPYVFALFGMEVQPTLQQMDAEVRRRRTFEAIKRLLLRESLNQPLVLIFEDLHWIDDETQGLLDVLAESVAGAKLLLLTSYRPEYRHEWGQKTYYTQQRLAPLGLDEAEELLTFLLGQDESLAPVKKLILTQTQGTPFFMEEVVQTLVEDGTLSGTPQQYQLTRAVSSLELPSTVQAILAARIDRLAADEKAFLQQLSVIGRTFPLSLVREVIAEPEAELYRLLGALQAKEYLYEQPAFPEVEYVFKHALTQEVAYGTVLQERRKELHEQTAKAIEGIYALKLEDHYRALAHHYSHSVSTAKAIEYLGLAGQLATRQSANAEAIVHLTAALQLLQGEPQSPERNRRELALQLALGVPLTITKGYSTPEIGNLFVRARALCEQIGDTPELFPTLYGLWLYYYVRADHRRAFEFAEQLLSLAETRQDSGLMLESLYAMGNGFLCLGEPLAGLSLVEQGSSLYESVQHHQLAFSYGAYDPGVGCLCYTALSRWVLGYPDQAQTASDKALNLARELDHPYTTVYARLFTATFHQLRDEVDVVQERAEAAIALSSEQGFIFWIGWGSVLRGWSLVRQQVQQQVRQQPDVQGIAELREGLAKWRAAEIGVFQSYFLALLAEAYGHVGQIEDGLKTVAEALAFVEKTDERYFEAELYRLEGVLLLKQSANNAAVAESRFQQALSTARRQQAKSWELRASISLARLWQQQGKAHDAHILLDEIYDWFSEGFDTKDLKDANALLQELAQSGASGQR